uniref:Lysine-specific demethylase n=1 Tax=Phasianus colchicus TaxID=9054 RepID=A0A669QFY0_PHACC
MRVPQRAPTTAKCHPRLSHSATNPSCALPLPEYCAPHGRLNLTSHLHGRQGCRWLQPRICASYGIPPQDDAVGTKTLSVEAVDSISVALHAAPGAPLQRDTEDVAEELTERLRAAGCRPAALWHVFRPEDAACIRDFLHGAAGGAAPQPPAPYLHAELRRRLREERGVSCHALLQCVGDAVLLPAGAPYQVWGVGIKGGGAHGLLLTPRVSLQVDGMVVAAVRQAVAVLRGCK